MGFLVAMKIYIDTDPIKTEENDEEAGPTLNPTQI